MGEDIKRLIPRAQQRGVVAIPKDSIINQHCYLCGISEAEYKAQTGQKLDVEHVVSKQLFAPHYTNDNVLLRACHPCNEKKKVDEDFVIRHLQFSSWSEYGRQGLEVGFRGYKKGHNVGVINSMVSHSEPLELFTPNGIYIGRGGELLVPEDRITQFCGTLAKGLWVRHSMRLMDWDTVQTEILGMEQAVQSNELFTFPEIQRLIHVAPYSESWTGILEYSGWFSEKESWWLFVFYSSHFVIVRLSTLNSD